MFQPRRQITRNRDRGRGGPSKFQNYYIGDRYRVIIVFGANAQHRMTFGTLDLGYRQEANLQNIPGSHRYSPLGHFLIGWGVDSLWVG